jgi:hypothetical protein
MIFLHSVGYFHDIRAEGSQDLDWDNGRGPGTSALGPDAAGGRLLLPGNETANFPKRTLLLVNDNRINRL